MSNIKTAFTINSVTTTDITITMTNYGTDADGVSGLKSDQYIVEFFRADSSSFIFNAPANVFTLNVPSFIEYGEAGWDFLPVVVGGEEINVRINSLLKSIPRSDRVYETVTGGSGVPCFTADSKLLTPAGYSAAKDIKTGDLLMTADGRQVPIKAFTFTVKTDKTSAPYFIPKNSLARNVPANDLRLSPWHAICLGNGLWQKPQSAAELNPGSVTQYDIGKDVQYYHFEAPNYFTDNFICEGTVVESFSSKQLIGKARPYTWSAKYQAYTRYKGNSKKSVA